MTYSALAAGGTQAALCPIGYPFYLDPSRANSVYRVLQANVSDLLSACMQRAWLPDLRTKDHVNSTATFCAASITPKG